ncbi:Bax inhibitor-1/YccA family protein [Sphingosinicella sp. BN140058]|uniref:Bax inhibitor-1/YccA family protein n=1 Tax=Sphingosinicella sp. BN140058 TaxID=1892855 RepID=UPI001010F6E5|nr:Bax inhibitor-1/YccA family protein [Sphingosinicella sp. BN140058]QAY76559.1 Bax inhibitor-1/YccA family protein [Sphingosinicella sp. BN140058]
MNTPFAQYRPAPVSGAAFDAGLRRHMLSIYNNMGIGLVITGLVAFGVASSPALTAAIFGTPLKWVAMFAPLAFVFFLSFRMERMSVGSARMAFFAFAAVMGVSLASIFLVFTGASIARTFFIAAAMFLSVSLWGYTTRRDLTKWSTFLFMGLIGVVIASLVNVFIGSTALQMAVSIAGVLVFTGLTAWDTQQAKSMYVAYAGTSHAEKLGVMGALSLYLNFVNLFQLLLTFFGQREE